jgi:hypothetical protein
VAIITFTKRRAGGIYFTPAINILIRAGNLYIEHNIQGSPMFSDGTYFALRKMAVDPAIGRGFPGYYRTTDPGAFFTGSH